MYQEIFIIDNGQGIIDDLKELFRFEREFKIKKIKTEELEEALKNIPALIIINEDDIDMDIIELCNKIRQNEDNSITPIIVISSNNQKEHRIEIMQTAVEYYLLKPVDLDVFYYMIKNVIRLMYANRRVSPLTGLPGNVQIQAEMKKRFLNKEKFLVLYFDLDNFKAYNDVYGFSKGDEIIKFTARTITKCTHTEECIDGFVGHIGGDDFVAIMSADIDYEKICKCIISEFDTNVLNYFNELDVKRGYVEVANRKGIIEQFPLTSISIGAVVVEENRFKNILEIGEISAQVKHIAKTIMGSCYVVDKRK